MFCSVGQMEVSHDLHVSLPSCSLHILRSNWPRRCSPSPSFEDAALETSTLCHNLTGWTSSMPMALFRGFLYAYHWCQVRPALQMTSVWPCQEQPVSKGLRAVQHALQGDGCCWIAHPRNRWILTASHLTAELTIPYWVSKQVITQQTCLIRGNVWPSQRCFDNCCFLRRIKSGQYIYKEAQS